MNGWLIYYKSDYEKNKVFASMLIENGIDMGIHLSLLLIEDIQFGTDGNRLFIQHKNNRYYKEDLLVNGTKFAIQRAIYPLLSKHLEIMGIDVYNNSAVSEICNNKALTYQFVSANQVPTISTRFIDRREVPIFKNQLHFYHGYILKSCNGHGGEEVFQIGADMFEIPDKDLVVQEKIHNSQGDLRVYVVGNRILACVLRKANTGFKSNFSLGGSVSIYHPTKDELNLFQKVLDIFSNVGGHRVQGLSLAGIDFIIDNSGNMLFNEVEDVVGSRMLYHCSDFDISKEYLSYIKSNYYALI